MNDLDSRQPFRFICADGSRLDMRIVFITEVLVVEVYVLLEMLSAGEATVKYLIRFIRALGEMVRFRLSVTLSVPGHHTPHILTSAS